MKKKRKNEERDSEEDNGFAIWGGYMEAKKSKLMQQYKNHAAGQIEKLSDLFKGVGIFVNGWTKPSAEELKIIMAEHGGIFHTYQVPSTTHIIASNLPNVKINKLGSVPIVKPGWILDSITLGRVLNYTNYLLYSNQSRKQPQLNFKPIRESISSASSSNDRTIDKTSTNAEIDPNRSAGTRTASDPKFLSEFYGNSRLHLIATLGAEFKQLVNELREKSDGQFPGLQKILFSKANKSNTKMRVVMHIDMDCFFVSVGLRSRPELRGIPVAVTHSKGGASNRSGVDRTAEIAMYTERLPEGSTSRLQEIDNSCSLSEIASCSYEARKCGIKNGMFMGAALKMCPQLKAIPYDFEGYREVSSTLYKTIAEYTLDIEAVSCDEMYVDCTKILAVTGFDVNEWANHIRNEISERTGCPCSTGFGSNRLQARMATKRAKPNGQYYLRPETVEDYMAETPLSELPGVGRATLAKLHNLGLEKCEDIQNVSLAMLQKELGMKAGQTIHEQSTGIDNKPLQFEHERKSVSAEVNYGIRFKTEAEAMNFLESLAVEVQSRLADTGMKSKCVTLKLMVRAQDAPTETAKFLGHGVCDSLSRSSTLNSCTDDVKIIFQESKNLFLKLDAPFADLRGLGIQLSRLEKGPVINKLMQNFLAQPSIESKTKVTNEIPDKAKRIIPDGIAKLKNDTEKGGKGRPKGSKNSTRKNAANKLSNDLSNYFRTTQKDRTANKKSSKAIYIDPDVLAELPEDIREEIMKEYNIKNENDNPSSQIAGCSTALTPNTIIEAQPKRSDSKNSGFDKLDCDGFKKMLKLWLRSETKPLVVDVNMLGDYFKQLATDRNIEKLHVIVKFLHRNIEVKDDCDWHEAYFSILNYVQEGMLTVYGNTLLVPRKFNCYQHGR